jgi:predicted YcjX-like family ATPase
MENNDLDQAAKVVVNNLRRRYEDLPERVIQREVRRAFAGFSSATVTAFVPVLAEREAVKHLDRPA